MLDWWCEMYKIEKINDTILGYVVTIIIGVAIYIFSLFKLSEILIFGLLFFALIGYLLLFFKRKKDKQKQKVITTDNKIIERDGCTIRRQNDLKTNSTENTQEIDTLKNIEAKLEELANKIRIKDAQLINKSEYDTSSFQKDLKQNKEFIELKQQVKTFEETIKSQSFEIKELQNQLTSKEENAKNLKLQINSQKDFAKEIDENQFKIKFLANKSLSQSKELKAFESKLVQREDNIKDLMFKINKLEIMLKQEIDLGEDRNDEVKEIIDRDSSQVEDLKSVVNDLSEIINSKENYVQIFHHKLLAKEKDTNELVEKLLSKIEKLEKKFDAQKKVTKSKIPINMPTETHSIKKEDGILVKRESFDDF